MDVSYTAPSYGPFCHMKETLKPPGQTANTHPQGINGAISSSAGDRGKALPFSRTPNYMMEGGATGLMACFLPSLQDNNQF